MEKQREDYSENEDRSKTASEYGNANAAPADPGNEAFSKAGYDSNATTGSGLSEFERNIQDGTNEQNPVHRGSEELINRYNINDQAHSDSSLDDFVKTTSAFRHADDEDIPGTL